MARQGCAERQAETQHPSPRSSPLDGSATSTHWPARMTPGTRVFPTRSNPNWLFAAERARAGVVGNTGSLGRLYSAETAETAEILLTDWSLKYSKQLFLSTVAHTHLRAAGGWVEGGARRTSFPP